MSIESELDSLASPLAGESPCGVNLEDTQLLASFDAFRLFGQSVSLPEKTDWRAIKASSLDALGQSRDLRLLAHFAAASLRVDGWPGFLGTIHVVQTLIKQHWDAVYPRVDEDAILRKNALGCLSDHLAIIDGLRRTPIIENKQLGRYSLRDVELATGKLTPAEGEAAPPSESEIQAVLAATPLEDLQKIEQLFATAIADLQTIDAAMREFGGAAASPDFDSLLDTLGILRKLLRDQLEQRGDVAAAGQDEAAGTTDGSVGLSSTLGS